MVCSSVGAAIENFLLSTVSKGLAACWTSGFMFVKKGKINSTMLNFFASF
ncbi:MAG: nitroreductase family protein [Deltaproteobacteria bacterium]|nr:nitroreductase family protein [Deltaproteobacteria bacterium]